MAEAIQAAEKTLKWKTIIYKIWKSVEEKDLYSVLNDRWFISKKRLLALKPWWTLRCTAKSLMIEKSCSIVLLVSGVNPFSRSFLFFTHTSVVYFRCFTRSIRHSLPYPAILWILRWNLLHLWLKWAPCRAHRIPCPVPEFCPLIWTCPDIFLSAFPVDGRRRS